MERAVTSGLTTDQTLPLGFVRGVILIFIIRRRWWTTDGSAGNGPTRQLVAHLVYRHPPLNVGHVFRPGVRRRF